MLYIYQFLLWILPERLIRTLFISSLYSRLYKVKKIDGSLYSKINKLLKICENDYALGAGISLSHVLWNGVELQRETFIFSDKHKMEFTLFSEEVIAKEIIDKTPLWLRYNKADMIRDIRRIIEHRLELASLVAH